MREVKALFDFDGTMTKYDSLPMFLWFAFPLWEFLQKTSYSLPILIKYFFRLINADDAKERLFSIFFAGMHESEFAQKANDFSCSVIPDIVKKEAIERFRWHKEKNHECILISASVQDYLIPWAEAAGFSKVLATGLEIDDGRLTGKFTGLNCIGHSKVSRVKEYLGSLLQYEIYVYGDSRGDKELLEIAAHSFYRTFVQEKAYPV